MILGTAGHIDHGKTSLVKALTGVDTDRLPEEKRRGITIELGFAPLEIDGVGTLGIVDVPGHEAFVRTMLAGATGIDLALLVVAADEGMMPQTREHLAILELLGVSAGIVAITKCDLADPDWIQLVEDDVRTAVGAGPLRGAQVVRCSAASGAGIGELRAAIGDAARQVPARADDDLFRMPVDRVFSVKGTGTVVTGTIWSGAIEPDDTVVVLPEGHTARVRGIESHGAPQSRAASGTRTAIALGGVDRDALAGRGSMLVRAGDAWTVSSVLRADVAVIDGGPVLGPRTRVRFHLGTMDVGARIVAVGAPVAPGATLPVRIRLDSAVPARSGDRFVIRTASPAATVGGGIVTDPDPPRRRAKPWPAASASPAQRLQWMLAEAGMRGVPLASLPARLGMTPDRAAIEAKGASAVQVGPHLFAASTLAKAQEICRLAVHAAHRDHPLDPGIAVPAIRAKIGAAPEFADSVIAALVAAGELTLTDGVVARAGWAPGGGGTDQAKLDRVLTALRAAGSQPPSIAELSETLGPDVHAILKLLAKRGDVVAVASDRYFAREAVDDLLGVVRAALANGTQRTASELRTATGLTRKYIIPFLEYCDREGITSRHGDLRALKPRT